MTATATSSPTKAKRRPPPLPQYPTPHDAVPVASDTGQAWLVASKSHAPHVYRLVRRGTGQITHLHDDACEAALAGKSCWHVAACEARIAYERATEACKEYSTPQLLDFANHVAKRIDSLGGHEDRARLWAYSEQLELRGVR